jgi:hypothetical protein
MEQQTMSTDKVGIIALLMIGHLCYPFLTLVVHATIPDFHLLTISNFLQNFYVGKV